MSLAGPDSRENKLNPQDAALILAATLSNFSWLWHIHDRWFAND